MKFSLFRKKAVIEPRKNTDKNQDDFLKTGREQIKKLVDRGIDIPVVLL